MGKTHIILILYTFQMDTVFIVLRLSLKGRKDYPATAHNSLPGADDHIPADRTHMNLYAMHVE